MNTVVLLDREDMEKLFRGEAVSVPLTQDICNSYQLYVQADQDALPVTPSMDPMVEMTIQKIIREAVENRDRSVSVHFNPSGGMSITVYPWPDEEEEE